jgi:hypothetical protein
MIDSDWKVWAGEALRRGPGCPDVEVLRLWTESQRGQGAATDPSWAATEAHVRQCARCGVEAEALRSFFFPAVGEEGARYRAAREGIQDLLARTLASGHRVRPACATPLSSAKEKVSLWRSLKGRPWMLAFQMALLVGVGLGLLVPLLRENQAPAVPVLDSGHGTLRGDLRPRLLSPLGEQLSIPRRFDWEAGERPPGGWIFRLERIDGSLVWRTGTSAPFVELPAEIAGSILPGSRYIWRVEASGGASPPASAWFEIVP